MKKILLRFFFISLLLIPTLFAEVSEYEGWVYNGKNIFIDNTLFKILVSENSKSILLTSDIKTVPLDLYSCEELENFQKICFNRSLYDSELKDYKVHLTIVRMQPKIEITRTVDKNILNIGETAIFQVTLKNTGEADTNATFLEDFPESVEIIDINGAEKKADSVYWQGLIKKGESKIIKYKIMPISSVDKYIKAILKYNDGFVEKEITSDSIRLYSQPILEITLSSDKEDYQINENIYFNVTFENKGDSDIKVNTKIIFPDNIELVNSKATNYIETIRPGKKENLDFVLRQKKTGVFFIGISGNYTYKNKNYKIDNLNQGFLVHNEGIETSTSLNNIEQVNSNQLLLIYFKVKNKNSFSRIKNIKLITQSDISAFDNTTLSFIGANESAYLLNNEIKIPNEESEKNYKIRFNLSYKTEGNETYSEIIEKTIVVKPTPSLILIPSLSTFNTYEEEPITISVSIKNPSNKNIKDALIDTKIPNGFIIKGTTKAYTTIDKNQENKILSFTLIPERVNTDTDFIINFSLTYTDEKPYNIIETKTIKIEPKIPKIKIKKTIPNSAYLGELLDVVYEIESEDTINDLKIIPPATQFFDIYNLFSTNISKLNNGEKITIKGEQIKPKKTGKLYYEPSLITFRDNYNRLFNDTSASISIEVKEAQIDSPSIMIEKNISKAKLRIGETAQITIKLSNLGTKNAQGIIEDEYFEKKEILIPFYETKIFTKNITFNDKIDEIPKTIFTYEFSGNVIKAYSNELKISIENLTENENTNQEHKIEEKNENEKKGFDNLDNKTKTQKAALSDKQGFFQKIFSWFIRLFKKN